MARVGEPDDTILFGEAEGILRVSANGGTPALVIPAEQGEQMDGPQLLPDGESVLFSVTTATGAERWDEAQIVVQSLGTGGAHGYLAGWECRPLRVHGPSGLCLAGRAVRHRLRCGQPDRQWRAGANGRRRAAVD